MVAKTQSWIEFKKLSLINPAMKISKVPEKIVAATDKWCVSYAFAVRKSVGNEFSSNLET